MRNNCPEDMPGTPHAPARAGRRRPEDESLGRPRTSRLPKPREERAAQFMPFAALTGFEDYLARVEQEASGKKAPGDVVAEMIAHTQQDGADSLDNLG